MGSRVRPRDALRVAARRRSPADAAPAGVRRLVDVPEPVSDDGLGRVAYGGGARGGGVRRPRLRGGLAARLPARGARADPGPPPAPPAPPRPWAGAGWG